MTSTTSGARLAEAMAIANSAFPAKFWTFAKGRTRPREPLFGFRVCDPDDIDNIIVEAEDNDPVECVRRAILSAGLSANPVPASEPEPVAEGSAELLPCPFCGSKAERYTNPLNGLPTMANCVQCGASAFDKKWNRRAKPVPTPDGAVTDAMVEAALHGADYIPNADNRKWMRAALSAALSHPADGWRLVPEKPTDEMMHSAACAHYGKRRVGLTGIDGISMTVNGIDYNFRTAFKRFWKGALAAAPLAVKPEGE